MGGWMDVSIALIISIKKLIQTQWKWSTMALPTNKRPDDHHLILLGFRMRFAI
jgi:hypothetical protein